ncbi:MAG TPA: YdcF family protein [Casimicrobiaceae bacterium]|nr:YdcF family protein [Casimicrobiaceae bacterium]
MDAVFWAKAFAKIVVLPPMGPLTVALVGLLLLRRAPRTGRSLAWIGVGALWLLCLPVVASTLARVFDRAPFTARDAQGAQAIVILGGGVRQNAPEYAGDTLGRLTLERVRYGARVAKLTGLPVLVTGGVAPRASRSEGALMHESLVTEYGVPVRWEESRSRNTHENARFSAAMLKNDGIGRVVLVAHAMDMPRAIAEFRDAGIDAVPAATGLVANQPVEFADFWPTLPALQASRDILYEMMAGLARRFGIA